MPAIQFPGQTITITGVSGVTLSCASTAGLYTGLIGTMVDSTGANSTRVSLQQILTATTFVCKFQTIPAGLTFTSYSGGNIYFDSQVVLTYTTASSSAIDLIANLQSQLTTDGSILLVAPKASPTFTGTITRSGTGTAAVLAGLSYQAFDTLTTTFQNNIQNLSNGGSASADMVATADSGTDTASYVDVGINSSGYNDSGYTIGGALASYLLANGGDLTVGTATAAKVVKIHTGGTLAANLRATVSDTALTLATGVALTGAAGITSSGGGIGYAAGAGGTIAQGSSRTTTVVLSKLSGTITMFSAAQAADALVTFTLTNTFIAATDFLLVNHTSVTNGGAWKFSTVCSAGSATISIRNVSNASITEATPLQFVVIKAANT